MDLRPTEPPTGRRKKTGWRRYRYGLARLAPPILKIALRLLRSTLRIDTVGGEGLHDRWARGESAIVTFWHNRLLMLPLIADGQPMCIMVSHHRDGDIATNLLSAWGIATVRGSTTRGAVPGFLRLVTAYRGGSNVAVVPDGPRGPVYVAKPGVVQLAKAVGSPIYPVSYAATRVARLNSWDGLMIPLPFTRVRVEIGTPLEVPEHASRDEVDRCRAELERRLVALTQSVEATVAA